MPTVKKQFPPTAPLAYSNGAPSGSILSRAMPVERLAQVPLKILLYGGNRVGKTTYACQFPKPLLLVSWEPAISGGAESVRKMPGVHFLRLRKVEEGVKLANELSGQLSKWKTLVIDSVTSLQDMVLAELLDLPTTPDQMSWGTVTSDQYRQRSEKTREACRPFLDLPVDTVFLAKEKDHNPPKEEKVNERTGKLQPDMRPKFLRGLQHESYIAADIGGATVGWLQDACDCICRLFVQEEEVTETVTIAGVQNKMTRLTGSYVRYLRVGYHPNFAAGVRSCTPDKVPEVLIKPTYQDLIKVLRG